MDEELQALVDLARAAGLGGIVLIHQGGRTPYLAACVDRAGAIRDPRNWNTHDTPGEAVRDLLRKMRANAAPAWHEDFGTPAVSIDQAEHVTPREE